MSGNRQNQWIDLASLDDISSLAWLIQILSNGVQYGLHHAKNKSSGIEFSQYRNYVPGDDTRLIDWKKYAKTNKLYIRQSNIESEHQLHLQIDCSNSMKYVEQKVAKLKVAKLLAACITRVVLNQGDYCTTTGYNFNNTVRQNRDWAPYLQELFSVKAGAFPAYQSCHPKSGNIYVWITDLYSPIEEIEGFIKGIKHPKTEFIIFHLIGSKEASLDFSNHTTYVDLETGEEVQTRTQDVKSSYIAKLSHHITLVQNLCFRYGAHLHTVNMGSSISKVLRDFFYRYQYLAVS